MSSINIYLNFNGNAEEVFNFYKSVIGGEFASFQRYKDVPSEAPGMAKDSERVMHVSLPVGSNMIMGCDIPENYGGAIPGTNFNISLHTDSREDADRIFGGLKEGGKITMPMDNTFWGSYFGMLTDKFGIQWMITYDAPQAK